MNWSSQPNFLVACFSEKLLKLTINLVSKLFKTMLQEVDDVVNSFIINFPIVQLRSVMTIGFCDAIIVAFWQFVLLWQLGVCNIYTFYSGGDLSQKGSMSLLSEGFTVC